jgi:subtilisin-like proprotein convertase family protein
VPSPTAHYIVPVRRRRLALAALVLALAACGKPAALAPVVADGKGDVADRVEALGAIELGGERRGRFAEDLAFHGYVFEVRAGATVALEISHLGTQTSLDATLYVYGPEQPGGGFGGDALAHDDDAGWGDNPRLADLALVAGGRYLVVVGTFDGRGRGDYRLTASCATGDCAPLAAACHPAIAADIRACAAAQLADPEAATMTELEAIEACADAEPAADAFDAVCAGGAPPAFCAGTYEDFALVELRRCAVELQGEVLDRTCALGEVYRDLWRAPGLTVTSRRTIDSTAGLDAIARAQLVAAAHASSHTDVTTAEEALARFDQGEANLVEVWDATGRRAFTAVEYGAGDNSYGRVFVHGGTEVAADIHDGDLYDCVPMRGDELRDCVVDVECRGGLTCVGVSADLPRGSCVALDRDGHAAEGAACDADAACPVASGLTCVGAAAGGVGACGPAWMTRRFENRPELPIPDGAAAGARAQLAVYGLGAAVADVTLSATLRHARAADLEAFLSGPTGGEVRVFDGTIDAASAFDGVVELELPVSFGGVQAANGAWTLRVVDRAAGQAGTIERLALLVGSRD